MGDFARGYQTAIDFFTDLGKSDEQKMLEQLVKKLIDNDSLIWKRVSYDKFVCITKNPIQRFTLGKEYNMYGCLCDPYLYIESRDYKGKAEGFWVGELWQKVEKNHNEGRKSGLQDIIDSF